MAKVRLGFVTNSSSSSFVVIGKRVRLEDIDLSKGEYLAFGKYLCEGQDVFGVTEEMLDVFPRLSYEFEFCLIKHFLSNSEGESVTIDGGQYNVWAGEKDYHCTSDAADLGARNYTTASTIAS